MISRKVVEVLVICGKMNYLTIPCCSFVFLLFGFSFIPYKVVAEKCEDLKNAKCEKFAGPNRCKNDATVKRRCRKSCGLCVSGGFGFRFEERTETLCVVIEGDVSTPISGHQKDGVETKEECKLECTKREWCKGIRINIEYSGNCRLLTNRSSPIDGWTFYNSGNWAEPKNWKEGKTNDNYRCLEKVKIEYQEPTPFPSSTKADNEYKTGDKITESKIFLLETFRFIKTPFNLL